MSFFSKRYFFRIIILIVALVVIMFVISGCNKDYKSEQESIASIETEPNIVSVTELHQNINEPSRVTAIVTIYDDGTAYVEGKGFTEGADAEFKYGAADDPDIIKLLEEEEQRSNAPIEFSDEKIHIVAGKEYMFVKYIDKVKGYSVAFPKDWVKDVQFNPREGSNLLLLKSPTDYMSYISFWCEPITNNEKEIKQSMDWNKNRKGENIVRLTPNGEVQYTNIYGMEYYQMNSVIFRGNESICMEFSAPNDTKDEFYKNYKELAEEINKTIDLISMSIEEEYDKNKEYSPEVLDAILAQHYEKLIKRNDYISLGEIEDAEARVYGGFSEDTGVGYEVCCVDDLIGISKVTVKGMIKNQSEFLKLVVRKSTNMMKPFIEDLGTDFIDCYKDFTVKQEPGTSIIDVLYNKSGDDIGFKLCYLWDATEKRFYLDNVIPR